MVFPSLSQGLLIIRDPIVIWIYYFVMQRNVPPRTINTLKSACSGSDLQLFYHFLLTQTHIFTIIYGARTNLLHFPLIFIMGRVLIMGDVINFGKAFLLLALPMTWDGGSTISGRCTRHHKYRGRRNKVLNWKLPVEKFVHQEPLLL